MDYRGPVSHSLAGLAFASAHSIVECLQHIVKSSYVVLLTPVSVAQLSFAETADL